MGIFLLSSWHEIFNEKHYSSCMARLPFNVKGFPTEGVNVMLNYLGTENKQSGKSSLKLLSSETLVTKTHYSLSFFLQHIKILFTLEKRHQICEQCYHITTQKVNMQAREKHKICIVARL